MNMKAWREFTSATMLGGHSAPPPLTWCCKSGTPSLEINFKSGGRGRPPHTGELTSVPLEEIPNGLGGVEIVAGLSDQECGQVLRAARPGMASAFDDVHHNLRAWLAAGVDFASHAGSVMRLIGRILDRKLGRSSV